MKADANYLLIVTLLLMITNIIFEKSALSNSMTQIYIIFKII